MRGKIYVLVHNVEFSSLFAIEYYIVLLCACSPFMVCIFSFQTDLNQHYDVSTMYIIKVVTHIII